MSFSLFNVAMKGLSSKLNVNVLGDAIYSIDYA